MNVSDQQRAMQAQWWAEGDAPVRSDTRITYLVDGRTAMLTMYRHFIKAQKYIYMGNWGLTAEMELVRGKDHMTEPDEGPQRQALVAELRAEGFTDDDLAFWFKNDLSLRAVLGYAVTKGVEVKVLLWKANAFFAHTNPQAAHDQLTAVGITCILDDSSEGIMHHPIEALHQKISIVDGTHAFVGGVDLLIESGGDFDRWDTPDHPFNTPLRQNKESQTPHPWHDAHSLIEGPAAWDVEKNFRQRWNDVVQHHRWDQGLLIPDRPLPPPVESSSLVQVTRTIPEHTYRFEPPIIRGIAQTYTRAMSNIQRFVYLENQYLWLRAYFGIDIPLIGSDSLEMERIIREMGAALQRGATLSIILPDHPNVGRAFSDAGIARLRAESPQAVEEGRLHAFCLATCMRQDGQEHYRPIYVHAKVAIVDDLWATVGSGNLNNRGMADDTEMNVSCLNPELAHGLRLMLQSEHLGLVHADDLFVLSRHYGSQIQSPQAQKRAVQIRQYLEETLGDPFAAVHMMHERAWDNLRRYQANQPLVGHLLPYLTADEAIQRGVNFRKEHGWIEEPTPI